MFTFNREKREISFKEYAVYTTSTFIVAVGLLIYIFPSIKLIDLNYEYSRLITRQNILLETNRLFRVEVETLKSLGKIEKEALLRDFKVPAKGQIVYVLSDDNK